MASSKGRRPASSSAAPLIALGALVFAGVAFVLGYVAWSRHSFVNWDGLAAVTSAYTVVHAPPRPSLSLIGFANPPLAALLLLPLAALTPTLCTAGAAQILLGAACMFVAVWWFLSWLSRLGVSLPVAFVFAALVFFHPLVLSLYAGGSPVALFFTLLLLGLGALANWASSLQLRDLI
ncbi:MAG: hypothetical protein J7M26_09725, partial [Armatimonadetes bacterium]|nr:hypothetical protein [Armatimonadota bacterium]